jgi:hypothetical protein
VTLIYNLPHLGIGLAKIGAIWADTECLIEMVQESLFELGKFRFVAQDVVDSYANLASILEFAKNDLQGSKVDVSSLIDHQWTLASQL